MAQLLRFRQVVRCQEHRHTLLLGQPLSRVVDFDVEPEHDGVGRGRQHHVRLGDVAHGCVENFQLRFLLCLLIQSLKGGKEGFQRPLDVCLDDEVQGLDLAFL